MTKTPHKADTEEIDAREIQDRIMRLAAGIIDDMEMRIRFDQNDKWEILAGFAVAICSFASAAKIPVSKMAEAMAIAARQVRETKR